MKIVAIGRNYAAHIAELQNEVPDEPIIFFKPDTAVLRNNEPFYYPDYTTDVHYEAELILRIGREGEEHRPEVRAQILRCHRLRNRFHGTRLAVESEGERPALGIG